MTNILTDAVVKISAKSKFKGVLYEVDKNQDDLTTPNLEFAEAVAHEIGYIVSEFQNSKYQFTVWDDLFI